jgi:hypothetical protein
MSTPPSATRSLKVSRPGRFRYPILEFSYDLILMLLAILSQSLKLLTERVPLIPLLLCGYPAI